MSQSIQSSDSRQPAESDPSTISIRYCDIPSYLRNSAFYLNLSGEDTQDISIPREFFKADDFIRNANEFSNLLRTIAFWGAEEIPQSIYEFCRVTSIAEWRDATQNYQDNGDLHERLAWMSLKYCDVPSYLHNSAFYLALNAEDSSEHIAVPRECFKSDDSIFNINDFTHVLRVMRFWGVDIVPVSVMDFCAHNALSTWANITADIMQHSSIYKSLIHRFKTPQYLWAAMHYNQWEMVTHWMELNPPESENGQRAVEDAAGTGKSLVRAKNGELEWQRTITIRLATIVELHQRGYPWSSKASLSAARGDNLDCLQYLHENGCPIDASCMDMAAGVSIECMKYLHVVGCPWDKTKTCEIAMGSSNMECLKYAYDHGCSFNGEQIISDRDHAVKPECIKYVLNHVDSVSEHECFRAVYRNAPLKTLQLLREYGAPWDESVVAAAIGCELPILEYAMKHDCPYSSSLVRHAAAVETGSFVHLKFLIDEMVLPMDENVFSAALLRGNIEAVQYLVDVGCPCNFVMLALPDDWLLNDRCLLEGMVYTTEHGWPCNDAFLHFVHGHNLPLCQAYFAPPSETYVPAIQSNAKLMPLWNSICLEALRVAAVRDQVDNMRILIENDMFYMDESVYSEAFVHGNLACVKYLLDVGCPCNFVLPETLPAHLDDARILQCIECTYYRGIFNETLKQFVLQYPLPLCHAYCMDELLIP